LKDAQKSENRIQLLASAQAQWLAMLAKMVAIKWEKTDNNQSH